MPLNTAGRTVRDEYPWLTEDFVRQASSRVPYQFGKRDYADYAPRPTYMTSGKRTLDPKPYLSSRGVRYEEGSLFFGNGPLRFAPRCDIFDNHNPILDKFREAVQQAEEDEQHGYAAVFAIEWLRAPLSELADYTTGTQAQALAQMAHARRVLYKLARLDESYYAYAELFDAVEG